MELNGTKLNRITSEIEVLVGIVTNLGGKVNITVGCGV